MRKAVAVLDELARRGIILRYAVGGGVAATFYVEPVLTYDMDVFVILPPSEGALVSLEPLYSSLASMGFLPEREHVVAGGIPVQLIPAYNDLVLEAVDNAVQLPLGDSQVSVVRVEYLVAIMFQTGRPKDIARAAMVLGQAEIDRDLLGRILRDHGLKEKWQERQEILGE